MRPPIRVLELRSVRGTGGGPEKTILLSAAAADPARFQITVCYIRDKRDEVFSLDKRARSLGVEYAEILERHSFDPSIWPALRRLIQDRQIDIVHSHEHKTDLLALLLSRHEDVIPLATAHGWVGQSWREKLYYRADKRLLARFPFVIAVSSDIRAELIAHGAQPHNVRTILNAIDPHKHQRDSARTAAARAQFGVQPHDIAIGAVGRLERQKRFDILIDAFEAMASRRRDQHLKLLIAGDGSLMPELRALVAARRLEQTVCLLGNQTDIVGFHHALDLFVQSSEYEGTPNSVLEAMALETPIVATDAGGTSELALHAQHALIVPINTPQALTTAMDDALFLDREATRRRMQAARRRVEGELSFDARRLAVESVYATLHENRQRRQAS